MKKGTQSSRETKRAFSSSDQNIANELLQSMLSNCFDAQLLIACVLEDSRATAQEKATARKILKTLETVETAQHHARKLIEELAQ